jgi:hypothetical protein
MECPPDNAPLDEQHSRNALPPQAAARDSKPHHGPLTTMRIAARDATRAEGSATAPQGSK